MWDPGSKTVLNFPLHHVHGAKQLRSACKTMPIFFYLFHEFRNFRLICSNSDKQQKEERNKIFLVSMVCKYIFFFTFCYWPILRGKTCLYIKIHCLFHK